jgi:hypothetical protein
MQAEINIATLCRISPWNLRSIMCAATEMLQTADQFEQDAEDAFAAEALLVQVAAHF